MTSKMTIASFQPLRSRPLEALDGRIGDVRGFYFSDEDWKIRHLIAKIRWWWFKSRLVLIPAYALERINPKENTISVRLTKLRITRATPIEFKKPVSEQQHELRKRLEIMQMPFAPGLPAAKRELPSAPIGTDDSVAEIAAATGQDPHLRSSEELRFHYTLRAHDVKIGRVQDFVIDDDQWQVRYLIVQTRSWFRSRPLVLPPAWIDHISFEQRGVFVSLPGFQWPTSGFAGF